MMAPSSALLDQGLLFAVGHTRAVKARSRVIGSNESAQRRRAPHERALYRVMHAAAINLRDKFAAFLESRDLLEDMAREAIRLDPTLAATMEKSLVRGVKRAEPIPDEVTRIVNQALSRAAPLFTELELELDAGLLSESVRTYEAANQGVIRQVGLQGQFNLRNPRILDALAVRANLLAGDVADSTFDAIKERIARSFFLDGKGPLEVARELRREFDFLSAKRSTMIARTETGVVTEMGSFEQYAEIGVENKRWLSALVEQTRPGHRKAHGQTVPMFDPFVVDDEDGNPEEMLHPLDPDASPGNVINCLCSSAPVVESVLREPWLGE